jgi:hypothetical protein
VLFLLRRTPICSYGWAFGFCREGKIQIPLGDGNQKKQWQSEKQIPSGMTKKSNGKGRSRSKGGDDNQSARVEW